MTMKLMQINGYTAVYKYDPETETFWGEFVGLSGGADFFAEDLESLKKEAAISLRVYLEVCQEKGIDPVKHRPSEVSVSVDIGLYSDLAVHMATIWAKTQQSVGANLSV